MTLRFTILLTLNVLASAAPLTAQTVGGQVVDPRGSPIRHAAVYLLDSSRVAVDSTEADSAGTFYLPAPKVGPYMLRVAADGLMPVFSHVFQLAGTEFHQERITLNVIPNARVYFEFEVQQPVTPVPGNRAPQYPPTLRAQRLEGQVLLQFVVDSTGRPLPATAKALNSTHEEFTQAVLLALPAFRFNAARLNGHAVAQLVQMPFHFNLTP